MNWMKEIIFLPPELAANPEVYRKRARHHHIWVGVMLTLLAAGAGLVAMALAACAYSNLPGLALLLSYFKIPALLLLNLLPPVLLAWFFYLLSGRAWVGFLGGGFPVVILAIVNYYKVSLRGDPLLAADLRLATEATDIMGRYTLELSPYVVFAAVCLLLGLLFAIFLLPRGMKGKTVRAVGALGALGLLAASYFGLYTSDSLYQKTANNEYINIWSDVEVYSSKGGLYPFLHSVKDMLPKPPAGYDAGAAATLLSRYTDADIPADRRVSVVGVMLEAFCDLSRYDALSGVEGIEQVYAPWHDLEKESVSGQLLTNIFAGGTVDSEWCFLTGAGTYQDFRSPADSYVWYFDRQGYHTQGGHPGFGWFYNRQNVNEYLGFSEYWFTENYYGELVDPIAAAWNSDEIVADEILRGLRDTVADGTPCFSFSVTYQNHGPYESASSERDYLPAASGFTDESRHIINSYLKGIDSTITAMVGMTEELEAMDEPVVLVLFGDHKPWLGNGNSVYTELGELFDLSAKEGFYSYYATPYLIWANSAAKEVLGHDMVGEGDDLSPCFLMNELFDLCGWQGPAFMQLSNEIRQFAPMVHQTGRYLVGGALTDTLSPEQQTQVQQLHWAEYYRQQEIAPVG